MELAIAAIVALAIIAVIAGIAGRAASTQAEARQADRQDRADARTDADRERAERIRVQQEQDRAARHQSLELLAGGKRLQRIEMSPDGRLKAQLLPIPTEPEIEKAKDLRFGSDASLHLKAYVPRADVVTHQKAGRTDSSVHHRHYYETGDRSRNRFDNDHHGDGDHDELPEPRRRVRAPL